MNKHSGITMDKRTVLGDSISWCFGIMFQSIGLINTFWGNDTFFGLLIVLVSFIYYPPVFAVVSRKLGFPIPVIARMVIGVLILWAALGVGELFDKIELMKIDLL
jgi:hypothetical protein